MDFVIDYDELTMLGFGITERSSVWSAGLTGVYGPLNAIVELGSFRGAAAEAMKAYVSEVHFTALVGLLELLSELGTRFLVYKDDYGLLDKDLHAKLSEDVLDEVNSFFSGSSEEFAAVPSRLRNAIDDMSNIVQIDIPSPSSVLEGYDKVLEDVTELKKSVAERESECVDNDFTIFDQLADGLRTFIAGYQGMDLSGISGYVPGSLESAPGHKEMATALDAAGKWRKDSAEKISGAAEREGERNEALEEEWAQQREEQGRQKVLFGAAAVAVGVFAIVATAGAATPLVVTAYAVGGAAGTYGAMNMYEGAQDWYYGAHGDISTAAWNPVRDTVFAAAFGEDGKQHAWDTFGNTAITLASVFPLGRIAHALGAGRVATMGVTQPTNLARAKVAGEFIVKGGITVGVGLGTGYAGEQLALAAGAGETDAQSIGFLTGIFSVGAAGFSLSRWRLNYGTATPTPSASTHMANVSSINAKGVSGGHNQINFEQGFRNYGVNPADAILSKQQIYPGIYNIKYQVPLKTSKGVLAQPLKWKPIGPPKTVYDPTVYSNAQMEQLGLEAMVNAQPVLGKSGLWRGKAPNGIWFEGHRNPAGEFTSLYPVEPAAALNGAYCIPSAAGLYTTLHPVKPWKEESSNVEY